MPEKSTANLTASQTQRDAEQWMATVLRNIADAVLAADAAGRIVLINPMAEVLTGRTADQVIGCALSDVFCLVDAEGIAVAGPPTTSVSTPDAPSTLVAKDGSRLAISYTATPVLDADGHPGGVVVVFRGSAEQFSVAETMRLRAAELSAHAAQQATLNAELADLNEELRRRNEELDAFSHTVAHDLKNPLNVISGFAQLLAEAQMLPGPSEAGIPAPDYASYAIDILRAAQKMDNIIQELLMLAEVRKADVPIAPLEMDLLVEEAVRRLAHMLQEAEAQLDAPGRWPAALGYGPWVEEVWINYLSNAIKYGGQPPCITLGAEVLPSGMVRFWVHDEGPGIALADQARLFRQFSRVGPARATGNGLGLSIVRRIVEKLGGRVAVESAPGQGTTFSFMLPAAKQG
jgi:PAS domain S-box-containing protein